MNRIESVFAGFLIIFFCVNSPASLAQADTDTCVSAQQVQSMIDAMRKQILEEVRAGASGTARDATVQTTMSTDAHENATTPFSEDSPKKAATAGDLYVAKLRDSVDESSVGTPEGAGGGAQSEFQLTATTDSTRASLRRDFSKSDPVARNFTVRSFVASAPIDKKSSSGANLATLDGLANGFEVSFNFDRLKVTTPDNANSGRELVKDCAALGISVSNDGDDCSSDDVIEAAQKAGNSEIRDRWMSKGRIVSRGYQIKIGRDDFSYYADDDLSKKQTSRVPWSIGGRLGTLGTNWYIGADVALQHTFKPAPSETACLIRDLDVVTECVSGSLAPPKGEKRYLVGVEGRRSFEHAAVGVRIQRDVKNGKWSAELPIFLFRDGDKVFNGGVRFAWTTTDKFIAGLFVGVPFKYGK
ncbi:hypothetical protein [Dokdonella immobilis]|uniref:Uncharacterized protein n=1 Tax=Dokdonella immobilis TaxID=578942 RepID=A0A1I5B0D5_9GAMM|nr:hypothetical protein [Dokdonella immobilis]SFN68071.1 hypothetical protein SAMN05216289_1477 [Dokdonella immobilis]